MSPNNGQRTDLPDASNIPPTRTMAPTSTPDLVPGSRKHRKLPALQTSKAPAQNVVSWAPGSSNAAPSSGGSSSPSSGSTAAGGATGSTPGPIVGSEDDDRTMSGTGDAGQTAEVMCVPAVGVACEDGGARMLGGGYPADDDPMWWEEEGPDYWAGCGNTAIVGAGRLAGDGSEMQADRPARVRGG
ncbi:MAG: hypothetical protein Q9208_004577 [Pyrenodesmia sp. 3 TL-2023]